MADVYDQADRAGAQPAAPEPEREWTDLAALARAVAASKSPEEALEFVRAAAKEARGRRFGLRPSPGPLVWGTEGAARSRAIEAEVVKGGPCSPPRRRPDTRGAGPLFRARGGA